MLSRISRTASRALSQPFQLQHTRAFAAQWTNVPLAPKDPILGVSENFRADPFPGKINVGVGAYRDDNGKPWTLPCVAEAQKRVGQKDHEYAPIEGSPSFIQKSIVLAYGKDCPQLKAGRIAALQALSGTGSLRLVGRFLAQFWKGQGDNVGRVLLPNPTWGNHFPIFQGVGLQTKTYRYWHEETKGLDFQGMCADIEAEPNRSIVLLHSCAHNPTGVDPSMEQWKAIAKICKKKEHYVLFDNAYQGFASGDADKDIESVRYFVNQGINLALSQSFAKNFGLYGHRIGTLSLICETAEEKDRVVSQLKVLARQSYSNPPIQGANLVDAILSDPKLEAQWKEDIKTMANRI
eukprot:g81617.t1